MIGLAGPLGVLGALFLTSRISRSISRRRKQDEILQEYREALAVPVGQALQVRDAMIKQMEAGLAEYNSKEGLLMLPSYIDILPTGDEQGEFFAIDLGGTNLRVLYVKLGAAKGSTESTAQRDWLIPSECFHVDNCKLMDWVADCTIELISEHGRKDGTTPSVGFCFSFPVEMSAIDSGKLLAWTKNFRGKSLIGEDVVAALAASFEKKGVKAKVAAILNDTVATLLALRYSQPDTFAGIILGTGTNAAYLERIDRITKLPQSYQGRSSEMVVNMEWGDFRSPCLPTLPEDVWVDCSSPNPGKGLFEKMISGLYMGDVARRLILRLSEDGHLFGSSTPDNLTKQDALTSPTLADIAQDASGSLTVAGDWLASALGLQSTSLRQRRQVQEVCLLVAQRSARLVAAAIAALLRHSGRGCHDDASSQGEAQHTVIAVDGSVFSKFPKFRELLRAGLVDVCGQATADKVELRLQEDGSVLGGAYIAAAADTWSSSHAQ